MSLPTREEISLYNTPDERYACKHFLGKTVEEAEALFCENSLYYQEDLMWMGPVAFRYYVIAAIRYIMSDSATGDADIINCFTGLLEFRLEHESAELVPIAKELAKICDYIIDDYDRFHVTSEIYGDVGDRIKALKQRFIEMVPKGE